MTSLADPSQRLCRLLGFLAGDSGNPSLRKDAIRAACDSGHWETARELLAQAPSGTPQDPELSALAGFVWLQARRYDAAEQALQEALAGGLQMGELRYNLAFAQFMQRRHAEALEHLLAPLLPFELPLARLLRARCLYHLGRLAEAGADCQAYLEQMPEDAQALGLQGLLLQEQGQGAAARGYGESALHLDERQPEALLAMALLESEAQQYPAAQGWFRTLLEVDPQCGRGWLGLALLELRRQEWVGARTAIEAAARYMPEHIGTWHVLAWIALLRRDVATAADAFDRALRLDHNFAETHGGLAVIAALDGYNEAAQTSIKRALRLDANALSPQYARIVLLQQEGRKSEADAAWNEVLSRSVPRSDMTYRTLTDLQLSRLRAAT